MAKKRRAKVWLHYRGVEPVGIRAQLNVREVRRQNVGDYQVIFEIPFTTGDYAVVANSTAGVCLITTNTNTDVTILNRSLSGEPVDSEVFVLAFGDLEGLRG